MAVRKRHLTWWYDFTIKGRRYRKPIPEARTKKKAEEVEDRVKVSIYEGTYEQPKPTTLAEFIDTVFWPWALAHYRTPKSSHAFHMGIVKNYFGAMPIDRISPHLIERFKRERLAVPTNRGTGERKPATVNRDLQMLSRILSMAVDNEVIKENPCSKVKLLRMDNQRERYMTEEEERTLINHLSFRYPTLRPVVEFALNTGMRRGEIVRLTWGDVDRQRGVIYVRHTKNGKTRTIPINSKVAEILDEMAELGGDRQSVFGIQGQTVSDYFRRAVATLKMEDLRFHDTRHTFATRLGDAGLDPFTIAALTGHSDIRMVQRYTHALESNKRRAVDALAKPARHESVTGFRGGLEKTG